MSTINTHSHFHLINDFSNLHQMDIVLFLVTMIFTKLLSQLLIA